MQPHQPGEIGRHNPLAWTAEGDGFLAYKRVAQVELEAHRGSAGQQVVNVGDIDAGKAVCPNRDDQRDVVGVGQRCVPAHLRVDGVRQAVSVDWAGDATGCGELGAQAIR